MIDNDPAGSVLGHQVELNLEELGDRFLGGEPAQEQGVFPEIDPDKVNFVQGMDITFVTSTRNDDDARELLRGFGMPFRES